MAQRARRQFTFWHVAATLPWVVAVLVARASIGDNSYLWHVTAGRLQSELGSVLTEDPFSFTQNGVAWRTQSWLADLAYSFFDDSLGLVGSVTLIRFTFSALLFLAVGLPAGMSHGPWRPRPSSAGSPPCSPFLTSTPDPSSSPIYSRAAGLGRPSPKAQVDPAAAVLCMGVCPWLLGDRWRISGAQDPRETRIPKDSA